MKQRWVAFIRPDPLEDLAGIDVVARDAYCEVYVDGFWKFTRGIHEGAPGGNVGFFVENGSARFEGIEAWRLEPMAHPGPLPSLTSPSA